jgi:hypothetical protein
MRTEGRRCNGNAFPPQEPERPKGWGCWWTMVPCGGFSAPNSVLCRVFPGVLVAPKLSAAECRAPSVYGCGAGEFMGDPAWYKGIVLDEFVKQGLVGLWDSRVDIFELDSIIQKWCPLSFGRRNIREYLDMVLVDGGCQRG